MVGVRVGVCALLAAVALAVQPEDKFDAVPVKSLYAGGPGSRSIPSFLTPEVARSTPDTEPPEMPGLEAQLPKDLMPEGPREDEDELELPEPKTAAEFTEKERQQLESKIAHLEERKQELLKEKEADVAFTQFTQRHVVGCTLSLPAGLTGSAQDTAVAMANTLVDLCRVEMGNVVVRSPDGVTWNIAVIPSADFSLETSASAIAHRIAAALQGGVFARKLNAAGVPLKQNAMTITQAPFVDDFMFWRVESVVHVVPEHSDLTSLSLALGEIMGTGDDSVLVKDQEGGDVTVSFRYKNATALPGLAEAFIADFLDRCQSGRLQSRVSNLTSTSTTLVCQTPTLAQEQPEVREDNVGMEQACYGRGTLRADNTCECDALWKDHDCGIRRCPVGFLNDGGNIPHLECSGQGQCNDPWAVCECDEGFTGSDCSIVRKCSVTEEQCSGHGTCNPVDAFPHQAYACQCVEGWLGDQCDSEIPDEPPACPTGLGKVNGQWGIVPCSGRGACQCSTTECVCQCTERGWAGPVCENRVCPNNCNNHGTCMNGVCVCQTGWSGDECAIPTTCSGDCNHRGRCVEGTCVCRKHFQGTSCSEDKCSVDPGRRVVSIVTTNITLSESVLWGLDSEAARSPKDGSDTERFDVCLTAGEHALVAHPAKGVEGWGTAGFAIAYASSLDDDDDGDMQSRIIQLSKFEATTTTRFPFTVEADCAGNPPCSGHGECMNGQCCCHPGFTGANCSQPLGPPPSYTNCSGCPAHHVCSASGTCVCTRELAMRGICSRAACPLSPHNDCGVCSGHGDCINGKCRCDVKFANTTNGAVEGWYGASCSERIDCPNNCGHDEGRGECDVTSGECSCAESFEGRACEIGTCPGEPKCNDRGQCKADGKCECVAGYEGEACEIKQCIGGCVSGACEDGECVCATGWSGSKCEVPTTCPKSMVFSNCTSGCKPTCSLPSCEPSDNGCVPGCMCPPDTPLWDEKTTQCVAIADCSDCTWSSLDPSPHEVALTITPQRKVQQNTTYVCAHHKLRLGYKVGYGLLSNTDTGLVAHARAIKAPIGIMVFDAHNQPIHEDWARVRLESDGHIVGWYSADAGEIEITISSFGPLDIKFYVIGSSTTAPSFLASLHIFASDCDSSPPNVKPPVQCPLPTPTDHLSVVCDGRVEGATCEFSCEDGFVLSHPRQHHAFCRVGGRFEPAPPKCLDTATLSNCSSRAGQICTLASSNKLGVCANGACQAHDSGAFCPRVPQPTGDECGQCHYNCNDALTSCKLQCADSVADEHEVTCMAGAGGWWSPVWAELC